MGKIDIVTQKFMRDPENFADVFNKFLYHGEQVIDSAKLREMDTTAIVVPYGQDAGINTKKKYRDVLKIKMADDERIYCLLGIENQGDIHYAMPVKNGLYDFMELSSQVDKAAKSYKKSAKGIGKTEAPVEVSLNKDAADVLNVVTGSKLEYDDEEEVDMCKAIKDMLADSRKEGREESINALNTTWKRKKQKKK